MKTFCTSIILSAILLFSPKKSFSQVNVSDSLALVDLYNNTDGPHWTINTGWLQGPVSNWYGVYVSDGRVQQLNLDFNNLKGTLPASIGNLSGLIFFQMADNQLTGAIPSSVGDLTNLIGFSLYNCVIFLPIFSILFRYFSYPTLNNQKFKK